MLLCCSLAEVGGAHSTWQHQPSRQHCAALCFAQASCTDAADSLGPLLTQRPAALLVPAGVTSYVVVVWDERSREACTHLNLPCFDASAWLPGSVADTEAKYGDRNFVAIM